MGIHLEAAISSGGPALGRSGQRFPPQLVRRQAGGWGFHH
ncbi:hypothetical protein Esi_0094_0081 [Ectocarpus siliculosus]|uniref:Uncharacterized protein n=1 Tax=Ectocarpus siliculosus TaxID=2880 RepID=D7G931_ECTSI|nr:hypothetical protein Esi_0094_0081 [Ectocarpus siliculosus]|eukprot:CBJ28192.1 hypothetical protein Esi_0094_0081 [Ectocarpus siliculosus]